MVGDQHFVFSRARSAVCLLLAQELPHIGCHHPVVRKGPFHVHLRAHVPFLSRQVHIEVPVECFAVGVVFFIGQYVGHGTQALRVVVTVEQGGVFHIVHPYGEPVGHGFEVQRDGQVYPFVCQLLFADRHYRPDRGVAFSLPPCFYHHSGQVSFGHDAVAAVARFGYGGQGDELTVGQQLHIEVHFFDLCNFFGVLVDATAKQQPDETV